MDFKTVSGVKVPVLGIGTWKMGQGAGDVEEINAIKYALDLGMTHIDTAEIYSDGRAEELVGVAIKGWDRKKLFITSKVFQHHLSYQEVLAAIKGSLRRLDTDYLDLYLIHWPNHEIPLSETIQAMDKIVDDGLVKQIGVSNFDTGLLKEAGGLTKHSIFTDQVEYSLLEKEPEEGLLRYCQQNDILLTAYSPLGKGNLSSVVSHPIILEISKKYDKTPVQIALNYLIAQPNVIAIPKSSNKKHLDEIVGSVGWELENEDIKKLKDTHF